MHRWKCSILALALLGHVATAATYYVDFDGGSDANNGTSTPWKHAPTDPNATGTADATTLAAGDTVIFKGGVRYRGGNSITVSGALGNPITFDGNTAGTFGTGRAIMDGSVQINAAGSNVWTQCVDAADARGNTNFANIYWTSVPAGVTDSLGPLIVNGTTQCFAAQFPAAADPIIWDELSGWTQVTASQVATGTITDSTNLTSSDPDFYDGCLVAEWTYGNAKMIEEITAFDPSTDTISFTQSNPQYEDRDSYYCILNHPAHIASAGYYAVDVAADRLYLWAPGGVDPDTLEVSIGTAGNAFSSTTADYYAVRGFHSIGYYNPRSASGYGGCFVLSYAGGAEAGTGVEVTNNEVTAHIAMRRAWMITISGPDCIVSDNNLHDLRNSYGIGILGGSDNFTVTDNNIGPINGSGINGFGVVVGVIRGCTVNSRGIHGNGIALYDGCDLIVVEKNTVMGAGSLATMQNSKRLYYYNNLFDAGGGDRFATSWGGMSSTVGEESRWWGNTMVNYGGEHGILRTGPDGRWDVRNNVIDGGGLAAGDTNGVCQDNAYLQFAYWREAGDLHASELNLTSTPVADIFVDPSNGDWRPKAGSPLIGQGQDLSATTPTDFDGETYSTTPTIGAWEFLVGDPTVAITSPTSAATYDTSSESIDLSGTASDDGTVASVTWTNDRGGSGSASGTTSWSITGITLQSGANVLTVTATDDEDNTETDTLTVTYTPPGGTRGYQRVSRGGGSRALRR